MAYHAVRLGHASELMRAYRTGDFVQIHEIAEERAALELDILISKGYAKSKYSDGKQTERINRNEHPPVPPPNATAPPQADLIQQ